MSTATGIETAPVSEVALLSRRAVSRGIAVTAVAVLVYGVALFLQDRVAIAAAMAEVGAATFLLACALNLGNYALRYVRWQLYLKQLKLEVPAGDSGMVFVSGFAMSITPAKMGELLKSLMLRESHGIPVAVTAPVVVAERISDVIGLVVVGAAGLAFVPGGALPALLGLVGAGALVVLVGTPALGGWLLDLLERKAGKRPVVAKLKDAYAALTALNRPGMLLAACVLSCVSWGLQGLSLSLLAQVPTQGALSFAEAQFAYAAPLLAGTLAMIPGGLGLTEATMSASIIRFAGASPAVAAALTILVRVASFWLAVVLGFAALGVYFARRRALAR